MADRTPKKQYLHDFTYAGPEISVEEAKEVMSKYIDNRSSVDLEKDDNGIAKICLNNPQIRNAISGKVFYNVLTK